MVHLETRANEESSYTVTVTMDFIPTTMLWSLRDEDGTVINSRTAVSVAVPALSNEITLTGDDLAVTSVKRVRRWFTTWGTYNGGANKFSAECTFDIQELKGI